MRHMTSAMETPLTIIRLMRNRLIPAICLTRAPGRPACEMSNVEGMRLQAGCVLLVCLFISVAVGVTTHAGQLANTAPPSFELASVRENRTESVMFGAGVRTRPDGSATAINTPLMMIIGFAYGLDGVYATLEGQSSLLKERFDISAKAAGPTNTVSSGEIGPLNVMMQKLLTDRFKLAVRWEDRSAQGYALVRLKPDGAIGPRMRSTSRDCSNPVTYRDKPPGDDRSCALTVVNNEMVAAGHRMTDFSSYLSRHLARPVLDQTGLIGPYDIQMSFNLSLSQARAGTVPRPSELPSLFVALQEQLGLKLEERRVPIRILVIEHVEPPTEN